MKKLITLTTLLLYFTITTISAQVDLTDKETKMFELAKTSKYFTNHFDPYYFGIYEYSFERTDKGMLKVIPKNVSTVATDPLAGDKTLYYLVDETKNIVGLYGPCKRDGFMTIHEWKDGRPTKVSVKGGGLTAEGKISYNKDGLPKCFYDGLAYTRRKKKKVFMGTYYCLQYDDQNRVKSVAKVIQNYDGDDRKKLKKLDIFNEWEVYITYHADQIEMQSKNFRHDGKKSVQTSEKNYMVFKKDGKNSWTSIHKTGDPLVEKHRKEVHHSYDENGNIKKKEVIDNNRTTTWDYEYDASQRLIKETRSSKGIKSGVLDQEVKSFVYNELDLHKEMKIEEYKSGTIHKRRNYTYTYTPAKEGATITTCHHKKSGHGKIYDETGKLIQEIKGNQTKFLKDGVWTDWKFFEM